MHPEQAAFEKNIDANPAEATNHYVYADWLREHGHEDEANFRQTMGDWAQSNPKLSVLTHPNQPLFYDVVNHPLPKGVEGQRPQGKGRGRVGNWELFNNYRHMEKALRQAFMKNRQQQKATQLKRRIRAMRYARKHSR